VSENIESKNIVIVAGRCGVFVGILEGGAASWDGGPVRLKNARHLRTYVVMGRTGDGTVSDLAARGLDPSSKGPSCAALGITALGGVLRVLDVSETIAVSFGVPS
jgi:hypothetical protein